MKMRQVHRMELQQEELTQKELARILRDVYDTTTKEEKGQVPEYVTTPSRERVGLHGD